MTSSTTELQEQEELMLSFEDYLLKFDKEYECPDEFFKRMVIYEENLEIIRAHNSQRANGLSNSNYTMGVNHLTDRRLPEELPLGFEKALHPAWNSQPQEMKVVSTTQRMLRAKEDSVLSDKLSSLSLPKEMDWRTQGHVITPVKNQGMCGSCWAFAATSALESHLAIATNKLFVLSVQELVSCTPNPNWCGGQGGCQGSTSELAYEYIAQNGMVDEWSFSYQSFHGDNITCSLAEQEKDETDEANSDHLSALQGAVAGISGFSNLPANQYDTLLRTVGLVGPVAVAVAASGWGLYQGGVYDDDKEEHPDLNHLVVVEGYGTDQETGQDYWLVRNSWGPLWGEDGYIRLKRVDPATLEDPESICRMDITPKDGNACARTDDGKEIDPDPVKVCGTSGVLFDPVIPAGARLL